MALEKMALKLEDVRATLTLLLLVPPDDRLQLPRPFLL